MNFIVAVDNNYAIGRNGDLIYSLPSDLQYFKKVTSGKVVVMGDKTYLSLPKHPLPNRTNIVMTLTDEDYEGAITVRSVAELKEELKNYNDDDVFVIGGASIYNLLMDHCKFGYITKIDASEPADTFIHNIEKKGNWELISKSETHSENGLDFNFCVFENEDVQEM